MPKLRTSLHWNTQGQFRGTPPIATLSESETPSPTSDFSLEQSLLEYAPATSPIPPRIDTTSEDDNMPNTFKHVKFWGDGKHEGENPQDFMNGLELSFMGKTAVNDADKVKTFWLNLKAGSVVKEWFDNLPTMDKSTFEKLQQAFELCWPERVTTVKTLEEKQAALGQAVLEWKKLGQREKVDGVEELLHIMWADKVERLAGAIPDDKGLLIAATMKAMPVVIWKLVDSKHQTWPAFCGAVRAISLTTLALAEAMEEEAATVTKADLTAMQARSTLLNATLSKALARTFQATHLALQINQPVFTPVTRQTTASNATSGPCTYAIQPPNDQAADVTHLAPPIPPNTMAGRVIYNEKVTTYTSNHGTSKANKTRPYPLSPGTCPVVSGECWGCGFTRHRRTDCVATICVPNLEFKWCGLASFLISQVTLSMEVNIVSNEGHGCQGMS